MISQRLVLMHLHLYTFSITLIEMGGILNDSMWRWKSQHWCIWGKTALSERGKTVPGAVLPRYAVRIWYVKAIKLWCIYSTHNNLSKTRNEVDESSDEEEWPCLVCGEPFSCSRPREVWVQCRFTPRMGQNGFIRAHFKLVITYVLVIQSFRDICHTQSIYTSTLLLHNYVSISYGYKNTQLFP